MFAVTKTPTLKNSSPVLVIPLVQTLAADLLWLRFRPSNWIDDSAMWLCCMPDLTSSLFNKACDEVLSKIVNLNKNAHFFLQLYYTLYYSFLYFRKYEFEF